MNRKSIMHQILAAQQKNGIPTRSTGTLLMESVDMEIVEKLFEVSYTLF